MSNPATTSTKRQLQQSPEVTTIRPHTRSKSSTPYKSKLDLIRESQSIIKDQNSAQRWLIKQELIIPSEQIMAATITMALLYISNGKYDQKELINGSHTVAICLNNIHLAPSPDEITKKVASKIESRLSELDNQIQIALASHNTQCTDNNPADQSAPPINSKEQATEYPATSGAFTSDTPADPNNITYFLLQLSTTGNIPVALKNGICTSAYLIKNTSNTNTVNSITNLIKQQLDNVTKQITTKTNMLHNLVQDVTTTATTIKDNTLKMATHLNQPAPATYAAILQTATNPEHVDVIARGFNADKQLLFIVDKTLPNTPLTDLTEKDLVTKANMALELMDNPSTNKPMLVSFITAKKLRNGNILFQLNSIQATMWLQNLLTYSSNANICSKLYHVIAEFVPILFDAGTDHSHKLLEVSNSLTSSSITWSKYVKPPHLRSANQRTAHIIIGFSSEEDANKTIQHGLYVEGKHAAI